MYDISQKKKADRKIASANRELLFEAGAAALAASHFLNSLSLLEETKVSLYFPIGSELDTRPLFEALQARNVTTLLPTVLGKNLPLKFKQWTLGDPLEKDHFDVSIPVEGAEVMIPDILVVPLLAFDDAGYRLGYGGGFYDRTLAALRDSSGCLAVGYAYAEQKVTRVTTDKFDQQLDWLVTNKQARKTR